MIPSDTLALLREIYKSKHSIIKTERSFLNTMELWAVASKCIDKKNSDKLEEIYKTSQGHYNKCWRGR